jgi:hypothetical protein
VITSHDSTQLDAADSEMFRILRQAEKTDQISCTTVNRLFGRSCGVIPLMMRHNWTRQNSLVEWDPSV